MLLWLMSVPSGNLTYGKIAQLAWWSCQKNSSTPRGSPCSHCLNIFQLFTCNYSSTHVPFYPHQKTTIFVAWFHHAPLFSVKSPYLHHAYHIQCWTQTRWCRCPPVQPRPETHRTSWRMTCKTVSGNYASHRHFQGFLNVSDSSMTISVRPPK